jgi:hypothetical protein
LLHRFSHCSKGTVDVVRDRLKAGLQTGSVRPIVVSIVVPIFVRFIVVSIVIPIFVDNDRDKDRDEDGKDNDRDKDRDEDGEREAGAILSRSFASFVVPKTSSPPSTP